MDLELLQHILDRAVATATRCALNGHPVERIFWIPPTCGTQDQGGTLGIKMYEPRGAVDTPPWMKI